MPVITVIPVFTVMPSVHSDASVPSDSSDPSVSSDASVHSGASVSHAVIPASVCSVHCDAAVMPCSVLHASVCSDSSVALQ